MNTLHVRKDDTVVVLSGKDKGKKGKVLSVDPTTSKVLVEGVNFATVHASAQKGAESSGIIKKEIPVRACKVMRVCPKCSKPTRLAHGEDKNGNKVRICKHCGANI